MMGDLLKVACWLLGGGLFILYVRNRREYQVLQKRKGAGEPVSEKELKELQQQILWISTGITCCMLAVIVLNK